MYVQDCVQSATGTARERCGPDKSLRKKPTHAERAQVRCQRSIGYLLVPECPLRTCDHRRRPTMSRFQISYSGRAFLPAIVRHSGAADTVQEVPAQILVDALGFARNKVWHRSLACRQYALAAVLAELRAVILILVAGNVRSGLIDLDSCTGVCTVSAIERAKIIRNSNPGNWYRVSRINTSRPLTSVFETFCCCRPQIYDPRC
nr:hypothetical protein CFP56_28714 [Quercus suber]